MIRKYIVAVLLLATIAGIWYGCASTESGPMNLRFGVLDDKLTVNRNGSLAFESGSSADFESGSSLKIAGTTLTSSAAELNLVDGSVAGTAVSSKLLALGIGRSVNYLAVRDTLAFIPSPYSNVVDSALVITRASGQPVLSFRASDADEFNITINTSDQALFKGAAGGYSFDDDVLVAGILKLPLNATMPDTTGFTGGEMFTFTGDTLYVYKADHTLASIP